MAISFDLNIVGEKYFAILFYEWNTLDILDKQKYFFCMGESLQVDGLLKKLIARIIETFELY